MAHSQLIEESEVQQLVSRGPGEVLKQARKRSNISLDEISEHLHLSPNMIQAIEADDQDRLPEPAYVKGYIRSYARYLELDYEPLIESYVKYIQPEPRPFLAPEIKTKTQSSEPRRGILNLIVIVILSIILLFLVVWWFYPQPTKFMDRLQSMLFGDAPEQQIEAMVENPAVNDQTADAAPHLESTENNPITDFVSEEKVSVPETTNEPFNSEESGISVATQRSESVQQAAGQDTTVQSEEFEMQGRQAPGLDRLTLSFTENSWTEVYDANKERLLFGLMNAGTVKELRGTAPFRVLLGNSTSAQIRYNDEPFDHSQFERWDKTARFNVGEAKTN